MTTVSTAVTKLSRKGCVVSKAGVCCIWLSARWIFASFIPLKVDVEGSDIYCMLLDAKRIDGTQGLMGLALPFGTISSMFAGARKQLAEALAERNLLDG